MAKAAKKVITKSPPPKAKPAKKPAAPKAAKSPVKPLPVKSSASAKAPAKVVKPTPPPAKATAKAAPGKVAPKVQTPAKNAPAAKAPTTKPVVAPSSKASPVVAKTPAPVGKVPTATKTPPPNPPVGKAGDKAATPKPTPAVPAAAKAPSPPAKAPAPAKPKGKQPKEPVKVVISAKPGQILLTPLKPTGALPKPPVTPTSATTPPPAPAPVEAAEVAVKKIKTVVNPPPLPPAPVTTDSKAKKNQAGLLTKELEFYRDLLLAKRREIVGDMSSMEREALRGGGSTLSNLPVHMADMGTDNYEQEFTLGLVEKDRQLLREINNALAKIQNGTYGICEGTGKPISKARLEAQPWSKYSIEHVRQMEQRNFRR